MPSLRRLAGAGGAAGLVIALASAFLAGNAGRVAGPTVERLGGPAYRPVTTVFTGQPLYTSTDAQVARWAAANRATTWLAPITSTPQARWINSEEDLPALRRAAQGAEASGRLLIAVAYNIPGRGCVKDNSQGARSAAAYRSYIAGLARALQPTRAVVVLEPDAVAADCFDAARAALLTEATRTLTAAGQHVYIDAGHHNWRTSGVIARRLLASGITQADGFALNVAARSTVADSRSYGEELSSLVGGRGFVVDTSRNGVGQALDAKGDVLWCNPPRQALGPAPSTVPVGRNVALLWIKNPGESDGDWAGCHGETAYPGLFSPRQARTLIALSPSVPAAAKAALPPLSSLPRTR